MNDIPEKLWRALDTFEDLIRTGERTAHDAPPPVGIARAVRPPEPAGGDTLTPEPAITDRDERARRLAAVADRVRRCTRCPLSEGRMNAVPGEGVLDALVMVIGEGPGAEEDRRGVPFVGRAGQYLDKWLEAIDISRDGTAFIGNVVKCRPPGNRDPKPSESDACLPYLREQFELVRPATILSVGRIASGILIGSTAGIGRLRGKTYYYDGIPLVPTYHPSGVLRNPDLRRPVWEDLKRLAAILEPIRNARRESGERLGG